MRRALLGLGFLVLALLAAERALAWRATRAQAARFELGPLYAPAEAALLRQQPALRLERNGASHAYGRLDGRWRCLSLFGAPADARAIQSLLDGVAAAEGFVCTREVAEAPRYGINTPDTLRLSLQGPRALEPGGDVRALLEIGRSAPDGSSCFVRKKGTREVWSIAGDLRAALERTLAPGLPPLLAPTVLPDAFLAQGGLARIECVRDDRRLVLERHDRVPDAESPPGSPPWVWVLDPEGAARELPEARAAAFAGFLERLPYVQVLAPERRAELGLDAPRATLRLRSRAGTALVLALGTSDAEGRPALWVEDSATLYRLDARAAELAWPAAELLLESAAEEPWSAFAASPGTESPR